MLTAAECRAARAGLDMTREELAKAAGINERTLADFERGTRDPHGPTKQAITLALQARGVTFRDGCVCLPKSSEAEETKG